MREDNFFALLVLSSCRFPWPSALKALRPRLQANDKTLKLWPRKRRNITIKLFLKHFMLKVKTHQKEIIVFKYKVFD